MSKIDKIFYEWDNKFFDLEYELGTDISILRKSKNLKEVINEDTGEIEFEGLNGIPDKILLKNNKIASIWLSGRLELPNNDSLFQLPMEDSLPKLNKKLKSLNNKIRNVEGLKDYNESDVLYLIFRGGFITLIGILKRKNK
ncbi:hypothetical protein [Winogradskyella forsetii]|uniref:hypothetical protein n=1 Tax=Winogradskyella forsetii TaxID=2686077 RepID=UPI0015BCC9A3|nr:hypothetical protein [Winogradskyella forsetii]